MQYPQLHYVPEAEDPSITIETQRLVIKTIDNTGLLRPDPPAGVKSFFDMTHRTIPVTHHLGFHGIRTFYDKVERRNLVIPMASWLNLQGVTVEGLENDAIDERSHAGVGRGWPVRMERVGRGCRMTIDPLPSLQITYTLELQPAEPDGIDFSFRFTFGRRPDKGPVKARFAWPCYMNAFDDVRLNYPLGTPEEWVWASVGERPPCVIGEIVGYEHKQTAWFARDQAFPLGYGMIGSRALILMLSDPKAQLFVVNAGGHLSFSAVQNPAWDWTWTIEDYPLNKPVGFDGRIIYTHFEGTESVLARYQQWQRGRG